MTEWGLLDTIKNYFYFLIQKNIVDPSTEYLTIIYFETFQKYTLSAKPSKNWEFLKVAEETLLDNPTNQL